MTNAYSSESTGQLNLSFALKAARLGVWELDVATQQINWDERCRQLFGLTSCNVISYQEAICHIHPDDRARVDQAVQQAMQFESGGAYDITYRTIGASDGLLRWVRFIGQAEFTQTAGSEWVVGQFGGVAQEVTNEEQVRQESEKRFQTMAEGSDILIAVGDETSNATYFNKAWTDVTGRSMQQLLDFGWVDLVHSDDRERYVDSYLSAFARREPFTVEFRILNKAGEYRWLLARGPVRYRPDGSFAGYISSCVDITEQKQTEEALRASEQRFQAAIIAVEGILWTNNDQGEMQGEQPGWATLTGQRYDDYQGYGWAKAVHPDDAQPTLVAWKEALTQRSTFVFEHRVRVAADHWELFSIKAIPLLNTNGSIREWVGVHTNITRQREAEKALRESEARLRSLIANAPVAIGLFMGRDLVIDLPNQAFIDAVGKGPDIAGKPLRQVMPELESQPFLQLLDDVFTSGQRFQSFESEIRVMRGGQLVSTHYNLTYTPLFNEAGEVYAILNIGVDVDEQVLARQKVEESEARFRSLIQEAPVATCLFVGPALTLELINPAMVNVMGKGDAILGKPLLEAMPEFIGQPFPELLANVYRSGDTYEGFSTPADLVMNGVLGTYYFDFTYTPLRNAANDVYAILCMAVDVTEQVLARQKIEETEVALRGAIEMAELGTWQIDLKTSTLQYSARLRNWFGISPDEAITPERAYQCVQQADRQRVAAAIARAIAPGSDRVYDVEYAVDPTETGRERVLHIQGRAYTDDNGLPYKLSGTARDVTEQRRVQQELERQVTERTRQLQASVGDLERSNQNLQQFAYVASHDLQEPLRKIQSFGTLISAQYADQLGDGSDLLDRMKAAANRMSILIQDLLTFSRISTRQEATSPVSLTTVITNALLDLDLRIQETGAVVEVAPLLPTVQGDASQLVQLFQNLLSNALKFTRPATRPHVRVTMQTMPAAALPNTVRPTREAATYYRIDVTDNGIGFDEKYADRIFQVFQRLHGHGQFAGTGIGLAICEKVVANHGGAIAVASQPGQGATFSVYLPA